MDLVTDLCKNICSYYKPLKDEELACRGFVVAGKLIEMGRQVLFDESRRMPDLLTEEALRTVLCPTCPFYDGDCDYILQEGESMPCGGFIFLGRLIDRDMIGIDDIRVIE